MYVPALFFVVLCSFARVSTLGGGREGPVYSCTCTAIQSVFQPRIEPSQFFSPELGPERSKVRRRFSNIAARKRTGQAP